MSVTILRSIALFIALSVAATASANDAERLVAAMLGDTPAIDDLHELTDTIGARPTGSAANRKAVAWAVEKFQQAEVTVGTEDFEMPREWRDTVVSASINGDVEFVPNVIGKPFSASANALKAPLLDGGAGTAADFERLGAAAEGAWILVETPVLDDDIGLAGLFGIYGNAYVAETHAREAGVAGVITMSPYPKNLVSRIFASASDSNEMRLLMMEREHAQRALRLLRSGNELTLTATIGIDGGGSYTSTNVIAEIPGTTRPDEIVLFGAHLDSQDLGTGALDNGVNVTMLINIARQIVRLGLEPERTIRFALWNGEEQGLVGSWKYTRSHSSELDNHIVAASFDIGSGRTTGFFTGGRPDLVELVNQYLGAVAGLGPFQHIDAPVVGTDNFDFMVEGVPNLIAAQSDANYASNYHAESDTFEKVDQYQARLNSAIAAAVIWGFANDTARLPRQTREEVEAMIETFDLEMRMREFGLWDEWESGARGRHD
jgi:Zn-dependent M28 family amino/carboxypeptidase